MLRVLVRMDFPKSEAVLSLSPTESVHRLYELMASALSNFDAALLARYLLFVVGYKKDASELLVKTFTAEASVADVGITDRSVLLLQAPSDLKPAVNWQERRNMHIDVLDEVAGKDSDASKYDFISTSTALQLYSMVRGAKRTYVLEYIDFFTYRVFKTAGFLRLPKTLVQMLIQRTTLNISEGQLFASVIKWCKADLVNRDIEPSRDNVAEAMQDFVPYIRFGAMSNEELAHFVVPAQVLKPADMVMLYSGVLKPMKEKSSKLRARFQCAPRRGRAQPQWFGFSTTSSEPEWKISNHDRAALTSSSHKLLLCDVKLNSGIHEWLIIAEGSGNSSNSELIVGITPSSFRPLSKGDTENRLGSPWVPGKGYNVTTGMAVDGKEAEYTGRTSAKRLEVLVRLDLEHRTLSFTMNDENKGVAFYNLKKGESYRPSVSATGNWGLSLSFPQVFDANERQF